MQAAAACKIKVGKLLRQQRLAEQLNVGPSLILGAPPVTIGPLGKLKINVLNKDPTVLRAPGGLGDHFKRDGLDSVPYA